MIQETFDSEILEKTAAGDYAKMEFFRTLKFLPPGDLLPLYKPMSFPGKRKRGRFEIIDMKPMSCVDIVNFRNAFLLGVSPVKLKFSGPTTFHKLQSKKDTLTTDTPNEIYTQYLSFQHMKGNVLVGGLGLGMAAEMILALPGVTSVTVVEKEKALINLIRPQISPKIEIVHCDLFSFLKSLGPKALFDSAYHDIWYQTGEDTWATTVVPLYRLSRQAGINTLGGWCEFDMVAQLYSALYSRALLLGKLPDTRFKPHKVFLETVKKTGTDFLKALVELYLTQVGTKQWEETFKWD